jgi:hypothetical protein
MNKIFAPTVLRQCSQTGEWFLMSRQQGGWMRFSYGPYFTLDDVRESWAIDIGGAGEDAAGTFRRVAPAAERAPEVAEAGGAAAEAGGAS